MKPPSFKPRERLAIGARLSLALEGNTMNRLNRIAAALALGLASAAPVVMAQTTGGPVLEYPAVADIVAPVTTQFGIYFKAAIQFSLLAVAGFVAWRYMKKTANKV